jgi:hypothetical protein
MALGMNRFHNLVVPSQIHAVGVPSYLYVFLLATGLGNLSVILGLHENPVNIFHFVALAGIPFFMLLGRVALPPPTLSLFFIVAAFTSLVAYLFYGIKSDNAGQPIYCILIFILSMTLGSDISSDKLRKVLFAVAVSFCVLVVIKNFFFLDDIHDMFDNEQRVWIPTLSLGGVNVEATFVLIAAAFTYGTFWFWPMLGFATFITLLYSSRSIILSIALVMGYVLWRNFRGRYKLRIIWIGAVIFLLLAAVVLTPLGQYMLFRFDEIGYEPGTESRFAIWEGAVKILAAHPFGVGAQNGIELIQASEGGTLVEDNIHSLALQYAVDLGLQSLFLFLFAIFTIIKTMPKKMVDHPLTLALVAYVPIMLTHFGGYETFGYAWFGLWLGQWQVIQAEPGDE